MFIIGNDNFSKRTLYSNEERDAFLIERSDKKLVLKGGPSFLQEGFIYNCDVNYRDYQNPSDGSNIRILYSPKLEWEPEKVRYRSS